jgi:hypothetical protein
LSSGQAAKSPFNEKLVEACVVLAGEGLQPTSKGKRVAFDADGNGNGNTTVIHGPFAETKELVAGFSIWEVASMEEAVECVKRSPLRDSEVELRKVLDAEDFDDSFPAEIAAAASTFRARSRWQPHDRRHVARRGNPAPRCLPRRTPG